MINRGGLKVFPDEVEEELRAHDAVDDVAVVGVPDDRLGEVPWAFVVPRAGCDGRRRRAPRLVPRPPRAVQDPGRRHRRRRAAPQRDGQGPAPRADASVRRSHLTHAGIACGRCISPWRSSRRSTGCSLRTPSRGPGPTCCSCTGSARAPSATGSARDRRTRSSRPAGASSRTTRAATATPTSRTTRRRTPRTPWSRTPGRCSTASASTAVDVVGYSMGAIQATRLVPVEPRARSLVIGGVGGRLVSTAKFLDRRRIADALDAPAGQTSTDVVGARLPALRRAERQRPRRARRAPTLSAGTVSAVRSREIEVPTLVVVGEDDQLAGPPQGARRSHPRRDRAVIPGNHLSAVGRPELTRRDRRVPGAGVTRLTGRRAWPAPRSGTRPLTISRISFQSTFTSSRTPIQPRPPTYGGT